jgi:hypothetical protein
MVVIYYKEHLFGWINTSNVSHAHTAGYNWPGFDQYEKAGMIPLPSFTLWYQLADYAA